MVPASEVVRADVEAASIVATAALRGKSAVRDVRVNTVGVVTETSNLLREKIGELKISDEVSVRRITGSQSSFGQTSDTRYSP
jgi:hypothetical protein